MSTQSLLDKIREPISSSNIKMAIPLLDSFCERNLLNNCIIGSDCDDGICIRWPKLNPRLFCYVTEGKYQISILPRKPYTLQDIKFEDYDLMQISTLCDKIAILLNK